MREYNNDQFGLTKEEAESTRDSIQEQIDDVYDVAVLLGGLEDAPGYAIGLRRVLETGHEIQAEIHEPAKVSESDEAHNTDMQDQEAETDSNDEMGDQNDEEHHDIITEINSLQDEEPSKRLQELAELAHSIVVNKGLKDPDKIKHTCNEFGTREVVGTGLGMTIDTVLKELGEYTEIFTSLQVPEHGGDQETVDSISGNSLDFQHNAYFALQSFYSEAIYALVIDKMDIFKTEAVLKDSPLGKSVVEFYKKSPPR